MCFNASTSRGSRDERCRLEPCVGRLSQSCSCWIFDHYCPPLQGVCATRPPRYRNVCLCVRTPTPTNSLTIHACTIMELHWFLCLLTSRRANMLFYCVRDAPVGKIVVKYALVHIYIHTNAIICCCSATSTPVLGWNHIVHLFNLAAHDVRMCCWLQFAQLRFYFVLLCLPTHRSGVMLLILLYFHVFYTVQ